MTAEEKLEIDARSIYVGNVDYSATAQELEAHFHGCGSINRVTILCDKFSGHPKGFAYIEFGDKDSVQTAMALDDSLFKGRQIKVVSKRTNRPGISSTDRGPRGGGRGAYGGGGPMYGAPGGYGGYGGRGRGAAYCAWWHERRLQSIHETIPWQGDEVYLQKIVNTPTTILVISGFYFILKGSTRRIFPLRAILKYICFDPTPSVTNSHICMHTIRTHYQKKIIKFNVPIGRYNLHISFNFPRLWLF